MKQNEQQQARHLFFQTDLNKSQIAEDLNISRTTLHQWINQNNWEQLKKSAQYIPAFIAENMYQILGNLTEHFLSEERYGSPVSAKEANTLYKLTLTINKLKTRATLNENMQTFASFTDHLFAIDPALAEKIAPHIDDYITAQSAPNHKQYRPAKLNDQGFIPNPFSPDDFIEARLDQEDLDLWAQQEKEKATQPTTTTNNPQNEHITPPAPKPQNEHITSPSTPSLISRVNEENERSSAEGGRVKEGRGEASSPINREYVDRLVDEVLNNKPNTNNHKLNKKKLRWAA